jgi:hypothetical protein
MNGLKCVEVVWSCGDNGIGKSGEKSVQVEGGR